MTKRFFKLLTPLFLLFFIGCNSHKELGAEIAQRGEIVVAMDVDMPGYFVLNGESYGYQYDLLKAYAHSLGVELRVTTESNPGACRELLRKGEVDMVATLSSHADSFKESMPIYKTSYVLLTTRSEAAQFSKSTFRSLSDATRGKRLLVCSGFKSSDSYDLLLDSLKGTDIFLSSRSSFDLIESLGGGEYDFLICEKSEAQLGSALVRNIRQVYDFSESIGMSVIMSPKLEGLHEDFGQWLDTYRNTPEYAMLNDLYFEKGIVGQLIGKNAAQSVVGGISAYDNLLRTVGEKEGHDWRFLSAIAYSESRFNAHVVSSRGAQGLMQIMPVVARQFNIKEREIMKPEVNITIAAKLLNKIERTLKMKPNTPYVDKMSIILACYNGGIGHVIDARNLAAKYGANPDSWADVSLYLKRKAEPDYNSDEVVKCGTFRGSKETLAFVNKVLLKYNSYCNAVKL